MDRDSARRIFNRQGVRRCAVMACAVLAFAVVLPTAAQTADSYPQRPVRVFVPYGPGGVGDLTMRLVANGLSLQLKQQFIIENRPGAGGILNTTEVLRARPDGYTLGQMGNGQAISMSLFRHLPYDILTDFSPISVTASFEMLLGVPDKSPYKAINDVVAAAKEKSAEDQSRRHQSG